METVPLEYPDYKRFSRAGSDGRIFETRIKDSPKIFCPFLTRASVVLGDERNGLGLSSADVFDIVESNMGISMDTVIDVICDDPGYFIVTTRQKPNEKAAQVGKSFKPVRHDVTVSVESIIDTADDEASDRRKKVAEIVNADPNADSVYVTLPQTWVIPDADFRPRTATLPLYPGSFWLQFFKSCWGLVTGATIVFGQDGQNNVGLAVRFKEIKAARQCVLTLVDRYLVHHKEGLGMKMPRVKLVPYSTVTARKSTPMSVGGPEQTVGFARPQQVSPNENVMQAAMSYANGSAASVPLSVAEAFQKIIERVEKLDRENQRLLSLLVDDNERSAPGTDFIPIDSSSRERSPRTIPTTGMPPWRNPR